LISLVPDVQNKIRMIGFRPGYGKQFDSQKMRFQFIQVVTVCALFFVGSLASTKSKTGSTAKGPTAWDTLSTMVRSLTGTQPKLSTDDQAVEMRENPGKPLRAKDGPRFESSRASKDEVELGERIHYKTSRYAQMTDQQAQIQQQRLDSKMIKELTALPMNTEETEATEVNKEGRASKAATSSLVLSIKNHDPYYVQSLSQLTLEKFTNYVLLDPQLVREEVEEYHFMEPRQCVQIKASHSVDRDYWKSPPMPFEPVTEPILHWSRLESIHPHLFMYPDANQQTEDYGVEAETYETTEDYDVTEGDNYTETEIESAYEESQVPETEETTEQPVDQAEEFQRLQLRSVTSVPKGTSEPFLAQGSVRNRSAQFDKWTEQARASSLPPLPSKKPTSN
jgi:hypothetical protein